MKNLFLLLFIIVPAALAGQDSPPYSVKDIVISTKAVVDVRAVEQDFMPAMQSLEMPDPTGNSHRSQLMRLKKDAVEHAKRSGGGKHHKMELNGAPPILGRNFKGNAYNSRVPNDNDMAISNDGKLVSVINSTIFMYDVEQDVFLKNISLQAFSQPLGLPDSKYDPKVIYDPEADRFIVIFLSGFTDTTSNIIIGFSATNDPSQTWNIYSLPGNPISNSTWSDYPVVGISTKDLYIGANTFTNGSTNNSGFTESTFWQISLEDGYTGATLTTKYYSGLTVAGKPLFNITPIQGGSEMYGPHMYLLSNRNLDIENDSIFVLEVSDHVKGDPELKIRVARADVPYGLPPEAEQPFGHRFDTNDGRILGGFLENDQIQFVAATISWENNRPAIYHGFIRQLGRAPKVAANIIYDTLDLGYPNIAYSGFAEGDREAVITFLYSNKTTNPGFASIFFSNDGSYSTPMIIKEGESYVNVIQGAYERWGDYSGSQRKYNEKGVVWASGSFGKFRISHPRNITETWVAELQSPDSTRPDPPVLNERLVVFPNPARDLITIEFSTSTPATADILLYDMSGSVVARLLRAKVSDGVNLFSFDAAALAKGMYILNIQENDEVIFQKKIVVQ